MRVLSLFDGISCGMVALERAGFKVDEYHAFEIDKYAIQISQKNYPQIIRHGSVVGADFSQFKRFDLVIAGTECQTYSVAGKMDASDFWQIELFKGVIDLIKPKFFVLENVKSKKTIIEKITQTVGVNPRLINSSSFSAQKRERFYWTNIPSLGWSRFNKKETLADICDNGEDIPLCYSSSGRGSGVVERRLSCNLKAHTLTRAGYSNRAFSGYITKKREIRDFSIREMERLQTVTPGYCDGFSRSAAKRALGNGWTVDVIAHIFKGMKDAPPSP